MYDSEIVQDVVSSKGIAAVGESGDTDDFFSMLGASTPLEAVNQLSQLIQAASMAENVRSRLTERPLSRATQRMECTSKIARSTLTRALYSDNPRETIAQNTAACPPPRHCTVPCTKYTRVSFFHRQQSANPPHPPHTHVMAFTPARTHARRSTQSSWLASSTRLQSLITTSTSRSVPRSTPPP